MFKSINYWYASCIFLGVFGILSAIAGIVAMCDGIMLGAFLIILSPFVLMASGHCFQKGSKE